jgi:ATP-dependent DNA helicase RecG
MLNSEDIKTIASSGEGYNAEFKVSIPNKVKELTEEICAFSNAAGGVLLIGVDDQNVIRGVQINNSKRSSIQNSLNEISPALPCQFYMVEVDGMEIAVIETPSGPNKPYVLSGAIYVRIGPNSQKLTSVEQMRDFFQKADKIYFDENPCPAFSEDTDVDTENLKIFRSQAGLSQVITDEQVFTNLRLFTPDGSFKNGAVLFFGKSPETIFEKAVIRCLAFEGQDKRYVSDDKVMTGPLFQQYLQVMDWLKGKIAVRYDIEGKGADPRNEDWEIPATVFKEAIINALSHRDYYERGGRIMVEVYSDRVEISNPGGLVSAISPKDFGKRSHCRNPLVFGLFERMRMVEQIGSGVGRMRSLMTDAKLPMPEFHHDGIFTVLLRRPLSFSDWIDAWALSLTANRVAILNLVYLNPQITKKELVEKVGISATAIDNNLNFLKEEGLLDRIGTKGGRWVLKFKSPPEIES